MAGIFSYAKTLWQDGVTAITAARLNHIEQGISDAADNIKTLGDSVSPLECKLIRRKTAGERMEDTLASVWPSISTDAPTIAYFGRTDPGPGGIVIMLKTLDNYGSAICFDYQTTKIRLFALTEESWKLIE